LLGVLSHDPSLIRHKAEELIAQRVLVLAGKIMPTRLERAPRRLAPKGRSNTMVYDMAATEALGIDDFIRAGSLR
jgi:hypothetical protein